MLPSLDRLRLGDATGERLKMVERPHGTQEDDAQSSRKRRMTTRPGDPVTPEVNPDPEAGVKELEAIANQLRQPEARTRVWWKNSVIETMDRKIIKYQAKVQEVALEIEAEHLRINLYVNSALGLDENNEPIIRSDNRPALAEENLTERWDIAGDVSDRWKTLVEQQSTLKRVLKVARAKRAEFFRASGESLSKLCDKLAAALKQLANDFPFQTELLETMRQVFVSFLDDSKTGSQYRMNFILMGKPGTGKTRMARLIADILGAMGIFVFNDIVEVFRSDFVANYQGQTAGKARKLLSGSIEKVIFLDEAYMLTTWDKNKNPPTPSSYSAEATAEMLTFLENNIGSTCFIAAGYEDKMLNDFLLANEGLTRRFTQYVYVADYGPDTLVRIYLDSLASSVSTPNKKVTNADVTKWFTSGALDFLHDLLTARDTTTLTGSLMYPNVKLMFDPQAGAMVTLPDETKLLLASSGKFHLVGVKERGNSFAIGPEDMKAIVASKLRKTKKKPDEAIKEVMSIAIANSWYSLAYHRWTLVSSDDDDIDALTRPDASAAGDKRRIPWGSWNPFAA